MLAVHTFEFTIDFSDPEQVEFLDVLNKLVGVAPPAIVISEEVTESSLWPRAVQLSS